jgi:UDP-3-O-[3-hydroxymyristoyl] glucosamine N-acyltransferase
MAPGTAAPLPASGGSDLLGRFASASATREDMKIFRSLRRLISLQPFNRLGSGNRLEAGARAELLGSARVISGKGNLLRIGSGTWFHAKVYFTGDNNRVLIGDNARFVGRIIVNGSGQTIVFGDKSTATDLYILCAEGCDVRIGRDCMFSRRTEIRTTDAHSVVDRQSGKRLNLPGAVDIGDHVWVGVGSIVSKGAAVPTDSVVAAMSFVNARFSEEGVILAGVPAAIVRRGVTWNRAAKPKFSRAQMDEWKA